MRHLFCIGLGLVAGAAFITACSVSADDSETASGSSGGSGGATGSAGTAGATAGASGQAGSGGATGGTGGQDNSENRPPEGADAGADPDVEVSCLDLDQTTPEILYLSTDDSNSMASPAIARRIIKSQGGIVPGGLVRTYEFLNYYNVLFEAPAAGELSIVPQMLPGAADTDMELQIGVQAEAPASPRRPMTLTFVLDTSGSMSGSPIELEAETVRAVAASLRQGDIVSAVTWNTDNAVVLDGRRVEGPNDTAIMELADGMAAGGGTDLHGGLVAGYRLAERHFGGDRINRMMLISDGGANVGETDENLIGEKADDENKEGIYLVGVGVGTGLNDTLMNVVTDAGNGAYVYIDDTDEAHKIFGSRFAETMDVAARAVQVKVTLPWYFQMYKFHGEQYSGDPKKVKPQHLAPGDSMVFHQVLRACDASEVTGDAPMEFSATWIDPFDYALKKTTVTTTIDELLSGRNEEIRRGRAIVAYAEALKLVADQRSPNERVETVDSALAVVAEAELSGTDPELSEIRDLLTRYRQIVNK
jgi:Ca-activated chloride channel homolog